MVSKSLILLLFSFLIGDSLKLNVAESEVVVLGTSTLHDWEMKAEQLSGSGFIEFQNNELSLNNVALVFPVKSLKSGKSKMDGYAQESLKYKENPNITFKASKLNKNAQGSQSVTGVLTIAGKAKTITVPLNIKQFSANKVAISGSHKLLMTSFDVEPPTVMFGTISTGDEVEIKFNFVHNL